MHQDICYMTITASHRSLHFGVAAPQSDFTYEILSYGISHRSVYPL